MEAIKVVAEITQVHITWALSIIGGTIATILGTSYMSPQMKSFRMIYLLFIPGWALLSISIYYGDLVSRRYIAAGFVANEQLRDILRAMNTDYEMQQWTLFAAIVVLTIWLISYLVWWIFFRPPAN